MYMQMMIAVRGGTWWWLGWCVAVGAVAVAVAVTVAMTMVVVVVVGSQGPRTCEIEVKLLQLLVTPEHLRQSDEAH